MSPSYVLRYLIWVVRMIRNKLNISRHIKNIRYYRAQNRKIELARREKKICIAYHGLERNGTNYLSNCLKEININVLNDHIIDRKKYGHKHFRWYASKENIPKFYRKYYKKLSKNVNLSKLNKLCDFPEHAIHVVIKKEAEAACVSFMNFAIRGLYYKNKKAAIKDKNLILEDYREYYEFWNDLQKAHPKNVWIIKYENFDAEFTEFVQEVFPDFGQENDSIITKFERVHMSPPNREVYVYSEDLA